MPCFRPRIVHLVAVVFAAFESLVQASYYLDDTDSNIAYVGDWLPVSNNGIDLTKLYHGTSMFNDCITELACSMTIPFNGSGITLYVMLTFALTFNVAIDGGTPTYTHFDGVFGCCNSTIQPLYNFTVYNITSLSLGKHTLLLTLLTSFSGSVPGGNPSAIGGPSPTIIYFDYAFVNSTDNANPTASIGPSPDVHHSTTSAVSLNPSALSTSHSTVGPAIGGTVGGIVVISIAVFILIWIRRRTRRGDTISDANIPVSNVNRIPTVREGRRSGSTVIHPDANILVSNIDHIPMVGASHRPSSKHTSPDLPTGSLQHPVVEKPHDTLASLNPQSHIPDSWCTSKNAWDSLGGLDEGQQGPSISVHISNVEHRAQPSTTINPTPKKKKKKKKIPDSSSTVLPTLPMSTLPLGRHISTVNDAIPTAPGPSLASDSALAAEEARFLRHLYDRNAPPDEIAELMRVMRAREGGG